MSARPHSVASSVSVAAPSRQKHLGAFYTPIAMAHALVDWAVRLPSDRVLDPSFGGLAFLRAAESRLRTLGAVNADAQLLGVDLDKDAILAADAFSRGGARLVHRDFLRVAPDGRTVPRAEAVVGNPPYVRYQLYDGARGRQIAERHGVRLTRMASSWAPMLIHAVDFVAPLGRMAQVLPAELLHAQYAGQVLDCMCRGFRRVVVVMFDEQVFTGAQEEVVLLFCEGRGAGPAPGVEVLSFRDLAAMKIPDTPGPTIRVDTEHKLLAGLVEPAAMNAYDELRAGQLTRRLGELASVNIGAVTGANAFFVRAANDVTDIPEDLLRSAVSKAVHVPGARFGKADLEALDERGVPARMLVLDAKAYGDVQPVAELIADGEIAGLHERYKCRIRSPWYALPASQVASPPHLFLTYMSSEIPRLVTNDAGALSTNTVHGVRLHNGTDPRALAASFYSSLTMLSAELVGRSYGGGVLKLEPTEAERLLVPRPSKRHARLLDDVDALVRARRYDELQSAVDHAVLVEDLGLDPEMVRMLRGAVDRLRGRRRSRATSRT